MSAHHDESATRFGGQFLIAMPTLADPNFHRTVTLVCEHNEHGALGVVVNRPLDMTLGEVLEQFHLRTDDAIVAGQPVYLGGPVQPERGFVVHDGVHDFDGTLRISDGLAVTTSRDVLEAVAAGTGPGRVLVTLGYAGWAAGQLEQEMAENAWLNVPGDPRILFETPSERRWETAAESIGVDVRTIAGEAGHA